MPEKQKILPMPKRTLKMIGTAEQSVSNQHESSQAKWGILPSCSDHQRLMRAIVPIQCTLQARKKNTHGQQQHIKRSKKGSPPNSVVLNPGTRQRKTAACCCNAVHGF